MNPTHTNTQSEHTMTTSDQGSHNLSQNHTNVHAGGSRASLPTAEDMFLSPRVMDAGTFARYSEMLKSIIAQATSQGRTLEDFSADAEEMIRKATESGSTLDKRLQAGVRMLRMIDERVDRTDEALDKVREMLPSADGMRRQYEVLRNQMLDDAQSQIDGMVRDAEVRAHAAEHRARIAMQKADEKTQRLAELNADLDMRMSAIEQRLEEAQNQSGQTIGLIDRRLVSFQEELTSQIDHVVERANNATDQIDKRIEGAAQATEHTIQSLGQSIEPLQNAAEKAMRTLGIDPENPRFEDSPLAKIESLVERGEAHTAGVDRVLRQLDDLRNQAEGTKGEFGVWLIDSANKLDELESRRDLLEGPIHDAALRISEIGPDLEDKLELASSKLEHLSSQSASLKEAINASSALSERATDRLTNQASQVQALLDGSLNKLTQRVEQAGVWLGSLITRAEQINRDFGGTAHSNAADVLRSVEEVQAKVIQLNNPMGTSESQAISGNSVQIPHAPALTAESTTEVKKQPSSSKNEPMPMRLPIDSISFDGIGSGSTVVIEHESNEQGAE